MPHHQKYRADLRVTLGHAGVGCRSDAEPERARWVVSGQSIVTGTRRGRPRLWERLLTPAVETRGVGPDSRVRHDRWRCGSSAPTRRAPSARREYGFQTGTRGRVGATSSAGRHSWRRAGRRHGAGRGARLDPWRSVRALPHAAVGPEPATPPGARRGCVCGRESRVDVGFEQAGREAWSVHGMQNMGS